MSKRFGWLGDPDYWRPVSQNVLTGIILGSLAFAAAIFGGYVQTPARGFEVVFLGIVPTLMVGIIVVSDVVMFKQYRAGTADFKLSFDNWFVEVGVIGVMITTVVATFSGYESF